MDDNSFFQTPVICSLQLEDNFINGTSAKFNRLGKLFPLEDLVLFRGFDLLSNLEAIKETKIPRGQFRSARAKTVQIWSQNYLIYKGFIVICKMSQ